MTMKRISFILTEITFDHETTGHLPGTSDR